MPWSISKANLALQCSLRYSLQYVEKAPGVKPESGAGRVGQGVHSLLENAIKGRGTLESNFVEACVSSRLTHNEVYELKTYLRSVDRFVTRFRAFCEAQEIPPEHIWAEKYFGVDSDFNAVTDRWSKKTWLLGYSDLVVLSKRGDKSRILIIDHKSGEPSLETTKHADQLKVYGAMALAHWPDAEGVQVCLHWPREDDDTKMFAWESIWPAARIRDEFIPEIKGLIQRAEVAAAAPPAAARNEYCEYCQFKYRCPLFAAKQ